MKIVASNTDDLSGMRTLKRRKQQYAALKEAMTSQLGTTGRLQLKHRAAEQQRKMHWCAYDIFNDKWLAKTMQRHADIPNEPGILLTLLSFEFGILLTGRTRVNHIELLPMRGQVLQRIPLEKDIAPIAWLRFNIDSCDVKASLHVAMGRPTSTAEQI